HRFTRSKSGRPGQRSRGLESAVRATRPEALLPSVNARLAQPPRLRRFRGLRLAGVDQLFRLLRGQLERHPGLVGSAVVVDEVPGLDRDGYPLAGHGSSPTIR